MYTQIPLLPMASVRSPRIDKQKMVSYFQNAPVKDIVKMRHNFMGSFKDVRNRYIRNSINKIYKAQELNRDIIQTRLNDKIMIFQKALHDLPKKA